MMEVFQSTPSRRGRHYDAPFNISEYGFNPLPHAEGDFGLPHQCLRHSRFNPLPHAEGDDSPTNVTITGHVSIHSLTQRETSGLGGQYNRESKFQSTPSRRGRQYSQIAIYSRIMFQSTPSRRGRPEAISELPVLNCFNPLPHAEGDMVRLVELLLRTRFNPLPHAEGDYNLL